jgi:hypothetical protein
MSDKVEGFLIGIMGVMVIISLIILFVAVSERGIADSCELSGSFVIKGKAYKCEPSK